MADISSAAIGSANKPDMDIASLNALPSESQANQATQSDDAYTFDPASSPRGNRVGREVGIIVFGCFMGLCGIIVVWWIIQRICQWRKDRAKEKSQRKTNRDGYATEEVRPNEGFVVDIEKGKMPDGLESSPVFSDKSSAYSVPSPDALYRHNPYSPTAGALARSRERKFNSSNGRNF